MNARDLVDRYWNLNVSANLPSGPFSATVSCNKYLIATQGDIGTIQTNQSNVISKARQKGANISDGVLARLSLGKASPGDMERVLSGAVQSGVLPADQTALQTWADANLGVDCTGFVIAYLHEIGVVEWNADYTGGVGCPWLYNYLIKPNWQHTRYADQPEIWSLDAMQQDDIILWMQSGGGPETKHPGHIALICNVDVNSGNLECAESTGGNDGNGHWGPQKSTKLLQNTKKGGGKQWWDCGPGVIVVRPPRPKPSTSP